MTPDAFQAFYNVPRGTIDRLLRYEVLLKDWQQRMNLVAPSTLETIWGRHFHDSAQLSRIVEPGRDWLDFGAGAGFPGLVLAAMDWGRFRLVESIAKKCRFLEAVAAELGISSSVSVTCGRVEALPWALAEVVTARATAELATLFHWSVRHGKAGTRWVFPKGRNWAAEVERAREAFRFDCDVVESLTDAEARILVVTNLRRKG
ncbi:MAG: 16S rRNA (guanine(527)-N(7))-methyltransferase RsmG [Sphingomonadaceae bacterium]